MNDRQTGQDDESVVPAREPGMGDDRPYEISIDRARKLLRLTMRGRWTSSIFESFAAELRDAEDEMRKLSGTTYALADGRLFEMQETAIAERFPPLIASFALGETRRSAVVTPNALARMQARPTGEMINARHFRALEDAIDWLFSDEA